MLCEHWNYKRSSKCPHKAVAKMTFQFPIWLGGPNPEFAPAKEDWNMCNGHMAAATYWLFRNNRDEMQMVPNKIVQMITPLR